MNTTLHLALTRLSQAVDRLDTNVDQALARASERTDILAQKNSELKQQASDGRELAVLVSTRLDEVMHRLQAALKE